MSLVRQIDVLQDSAERPATLLVFLPPAQASIEDYLHQGFISALRERHICADALLAAITYEDVMSKTVAQRLHTCVIRPAITKGYSQIWLVGISLGAFNALHYAAIHANDLAGILLIAPYPGTNDILNEIAAAGGPLSWSASPLAEQGDERIWWRWLCQHSLPVYFATGAEDRFFRGQKMLAGLLPSSRIHITPGNHTWPTWRRLWDCWLDTGPLAAMID